MTTIVSFNETTSREIAALAEAEGCTVEQWLNRYTLDIHRGVTDRGGVEAIEAENAARREAARAAEEAARIAAEQAGSAAEEAVVEA